MSQLFCKLCFDNNHSISDCKENKEELHSLEEIAAFIGARLNYVLPICNSGVRGGKLISTINVVQHKEKFWMVRIYCSLADEKLVAKKWLETRETAECGETPTPEFIEKCFRHDAWHYRRCYLDMIKIVSPKLKSRIRKHADYYELLFDDEIEMRDYFNNKCSTNSDPLEYYRAKYSVVTNEELMTKLAKFYKQPSYKEANF